MLSKSFQIHVDAAIMVGLLLLASLALNVYFQRINAELTVNHTQMHLQHLQNQLNIESCRDALQEMQIERARQIER